MAKGLRSAQQSTWQLTPISPQRPESWATCGFAFICCPPYCFGKAQWYIRRKTYSNMNLGTGPWREKGRGRGDKRSSRREVIEATLLLDNIACRFYCSFSRSLVGPFAEFRRAEPRSTMLRPARTATGHSPWSSSKDRSQFRLLAAWHRSRENCSN